MEAGRLVDDAKVKRFVKQDEELVDGSERHHPKGDNGRHGGGLRPLFVDLDEHLLLDVRDGQTAVSDPHEITGFEYRPEPEPVAFQHGRQSVLYLRLEARQEDLAGLVAPRPFVDHAPRRPLVQHGLLTRHQPLLVIAVP